MKIFLSRSSSEEKGTETSLIISKASFFTSCHDPLRRKKELKQDSLKFLASNREVMSRSSSEEKGTETIGIAASYGPTLESRSSSEEKGTETNLLHHLIYLILCHDPLRRKKELKHNGYAQLVSTFTVTILFGGKRN